jgi:1,4-alpha-glucan branching enzyme
LPKAAAPGAEKVTLVGDFNGWDMTGTEMKKLKSGDFTVTIDLCRDKEYRFKYCIDSHRWENDWCADKYISNPFGSEDSVVIL